MVLLFLSKFLSNPGQEDVDKEAKGYENDENHKSAVGKHG